jgi:ribosomal-protein-alanine N-acetyltransferase
MTPSQFQLRHAAVSDIDAIIALERSTENAPHWPASIYPAIFELDSLRHSVVAVANGSLAGFAVGRIHPASQDSIEHVAELESVVVSINARRTGIGRALCLAVIDWCKSQGATEVVLEARASSTGAISLYSSLGFTQTGRRPRYYRDPEDDALMMTLQLNPDVLGRESF